MGLLLRTASTPAHSTTRTAAAATTALTTSTCFTRRTWRVTSVSAYQQSMPSAGPDSRKRLKSQDGPFVDLVKDAALEYTIYQVYY